jgi:hypothetical protein
MGAGVTAARHAVISVPWFRIRNPIGLGVNGCERRRGSDMPRPSKGDRKPWTVRLPRSLNTTVVEAAAAAGYDYVADYIVDVVSMAHKAGIHPQPQVRQERLPVSA